MPPFVSVIVPVLNAEATIARCLEALLAQTYPNANYEIVVVDNGSSDRSVEIARRYRVALCHEHSIQTSYAARNTGVRNARGELVAFIDADCIADPRWLAELIEPLADPHRGASLGTIADAEAATLVQEFSAVVQPLARPQRRGLRTLLTANAAVRRSVFDAAGGFRDYLPTGGDVDFGWRIQRELGLELADARGAIVRHVHRSTLRAVFAQYRRYGLSEILLTTLHSGDAGSTTRNEQIRRILQQLRACVSYILAFAFRIARSLFVRADRKYLVWPLFLLFVESGNVYGKIRGLLATRWYRTTPRLSPASAR